MGVILSVAAILFFVAREAWPLSRAASGDPRRVSERLWTPAELPLLVRADEHRSLVLCVLPSGQVEVRRASDGSLVQTLKLGLPSGVRLIAAAPAINDARVALAASNGRVWVVDLGFRPDPQSGPRQVVPQIAPRGDYPLFTPGRGLTALAFRRQEGRLALAAAETDGDLRVRVEEADDGLARQDSIVPPSGAVTSLAITGDAGTLVAGTGDGRLVRWSLSAQAPPRFEEEAGAGTAPSAITVLALLNGGRSLVVAARDGGVSVWSLARDRAHPSGQSLRRLHQLPRAPAAVTALVSSERTRSFLAADAGGGMSLYHSTSSRRLLRLAPAGPAVPVTRLAFAPRADGAAGVDAAGSLWVWSLRAPHPEVSWDTLFGRVWYEGYDRPRYVWQSAGSSDDFEPKLSLTPLIFGTLKGTLYALLFAVPLAILGAVYTALFAHAKVRAFAKPAIELMAALPSVVVGLLAGLWLAPRVERSLPGVLLAFVLLPALALAGAALWGLAPAAARRRLRPGGELAVLIPLLLVGIGLALEWGPRLEPWVFAGDLKAWLYQTLGLAYDQRNALVVGLAMGFAVIPIIFTISEDALSSVPDHLRAGALALGASRWQAALHVILPTASPGIFSAVMIGFGRAVGETMIVLMATGNTPVLDWSPFNGLRTLAANIAVEVPEAPQGGALYRVLFLAAALLFAMTFLVNTAAELVRQRLRARFARL